MVWLRVVQVGLCIPPKLRENVIVGFFDEDTAREEIIVAVKYFVSVHSTVKDWIVPGKYSNLGKVEFVTSKAMWPWVKAHGGQKLSALGRDDGEG